VHTYNIAFSVLLIIRCQLRDTHTYIHIHTLRIFHSVSATHTYIHTHTYIYIYTHTHTPRTHTPHITHTCTHTHTHPRRLLDNAGVTLITGTAKFKDNHTVSVGDRTITADHILVAVGGWPSVPDFPGKVCVCVCVYASLPWEGVCVCVCVCMPHFPGKMCVCVRCIIPTWHIYMHVWCVYITGSYICTHAHTRWHTRIYICMCGVCIYTGSIYAHMHIHGGMCGMLCRSLPSPLYIPHVHTCTHTTHTHSHTHTLTHSHTHSHTHTHTLTHSICVHTPHTPPPPLHIYLHHITSIYNDTYITHISTCAT